MFKDRIRDFRRVRAGDLLANPKNWREHPETQRAALQAVMAEVGVADAVLARETPAGLELIDGHLRAGLDADAVLPVLVLDVNAQEADKLLATIDPLAAMAEVNDQKLRELLATIEAESDEMKALVEKVASDNGVKGDVEVEEDDAPEADTVPTRCKAGDLWRLGEHRLLCGDSTKAEDVARVMGGEKADLCFTSPPYGAGNVAKLRDHYVRGAEKRESFYDRHEDDPGDWPALMDGWVAAIRPVASAIVCNVQMLADNKRALIQWVAKNMDDLCDVLIWDKKHAAPQMQKNIVSNTFEFLFVFGGNGSRTIPFANFHGTIQNIVRIDPKGANEVAEIHRAVMPVALPLWVMRDLCSTSKSVVEPFCGSGTTLIAAEQLGRKCYGIEISPKYCDVIIARWEKLTGKTATKIEG